MKTIRYTLSVAWKEILIISKDRGTLALMVMLPLLLGSIFGGINYQLNKAGEDPNILFEVYIVNNDPGKFGGQLQAALEDIELFKIINTEDVESVEQEVAEGNAAAAIIIPVGFSSDIDSYSPTKVEVIVDPAVPESSRSS